MSDASIAQYGTPTPTPTCVSCGPPPDLPHTGHDVALQMGAGGVLLALGVVGVIIMRWTKT